MNKHLKKIYRNTIKDLILRVVLRKKAQFRSEAFVRDSYESAYKAVDNDGLRRVLHARQHCLYGGKPALYAGAESKKFLLERFSNIIDLHSVNSLLEIGCGRGLNVLALAALHPNLKKVHGVELTQAGVDQAKKYLINPPSFALHMLTGLSEDLIQSRLKNRDIDFVMGSARNLPFDDGLFDAVFSNSVLEQFPRDYEIAFKEANRVSSRLGFFSEPFEEAQRNILQKIYLRNIDYFCAPYECVKTSGWKIIGYETPLLQKMLFSTSILLCEKNS